MSTREQLVKSINEALDYEKWRNNYDKSLHDRNDLLEKENNLFRNIIQDVLDFGKLYHHHKKKLKEYGFNTLDTKTKNIKEVKKWVLDVMVVSVVVIVKNILNKEITKVMKNES